MAGIDAFGQPTWTDADPVDLGVQLTTAADSLAHGPYRRGTAAERAAVTPIYDGLTWWQTDGQSGLWRVEGGAWRHLPHIRHGQHGSTTVGSWTSLGPPSALPEGTPMSIQAGYFSGGETSGGTITVTFPEPFPTGCVSVVTQVIGGFNPILWSMTSTGFSTLWGDQANTRRTFTWIAIGY